MGVGTRDLDYANLPENFIPDGMAVMETTRIRHRRDGYVEKTREERKRLRDAAMARAATARRQKSEAIQMLGDSAIGARTFLLRLILLLRSRFVAA